MDLNRIGLAMRPAGAGRKFSGAIALVCLAAACGAAGAQAGQDYAFLVAAGNYDKKELNPLKYSCPDVIAFRETLIRSGMKSENIVLMHDAEPRVSARYLPEAKKVREELSLLLAQIEEDDSLIVALAGHGVQFAGEKGSFFCPSDAKLGDRETLIGLEEVYEMLEACPAKRKLLLVDACRNDPLSELARSRPTMKLESVTRPQSEPVPEGIVALFSCREGQKSFEHPELRHGLFFHSILEGWGGAADSDRDGKLTLDELIGFSKLKTQNLAREEFKASQIPQQRGEFSGVWVLRDIRFGRATPYDPNIHRKLPAGLRPKSNTGADATGWPLEVIFVKDGSEMVLVPAGSFQMGNDRPQQGPIHAVTLRAFYIDKFEVTNAQFQRFVDEAAHSSPQWQQGADRAGIANKLDHPVVWTNWEDAQAYAGWAGKQLPTEAQWERAARGDAAGPFPWGDHLPHGRCNQLGESDGFESTAPVGKFPNGASPFGCHDMAGNAAEWCRDWWHESYAAAAATDPSGPPTGKFRVIRGGSWSDDDEFLFATYRIADAPKKRSSSYGFRCVVELTD